MLADQDRIQVRSARETIRRPTNARLMAALTPHRPTSDQERPQRRLSTLLRRLAGTAYTAA